MNNYIITESVGKMREIARKELKGYWKPVAITFFIYYLFTATVSQFLDIFFANNKSFEVAGQMFTYNVSAVGSVYTFVVAGAFSYGLALFALTFFRTKNVINPLLFEGFSCLGKVFVLYLLMTIKIFLWSLLFVIPGIIASFRYSQCFFVMCDHPEYTPSMCIKESCILMNGNKGKLFVLVLSYIGWMILASVPSGIIGEIEMSSELTKVLLETLLNIPLVFVEVYIFIGTVVFYELLTRNLVIMNPYDNQNNDVNAYNHYNSYNPDNVVNAQYEVHDNVVPEDAPVQQEADVNEFVSNSENTEGNINEQ